jgi:hypothetical protein
MRLALSAIVPMIALAAAGCANITTYETVMDVCSSGNGTVKSAKVLKSSGDPAADKYAVDEVAMAAVYEPSEELVCRPLTVEHRVAGAHPTS